jgi:hypothetical protein
MALEVADKFRTNPLSLISGGYTVRVIKKDGKELDCSNIKNAKAFIRKVLQDSEVKEAYVVFN